MVATLRQSDVGLRPRDIGAWSVEFTPWLLVEGFDDEPAADVVEEVLLVEGAEIRIRLKSIKRIARGATRAVSKVAKKAGRATGKAIRTAAKASGKVVDRLDRVPVVGRPLSAVYGLAVSGPLELANKIASGARIDKAVLGHFKKQLRRIKTVAPYVQMVVSFVPGVGQGVSAAIGAGLALAEGRPLTDAVMEGIRGAIPGGPAGRAAFDLGRAVLSGKKVDHEALVGVAAGALRLPPTQRRLLTQGLLAATDIAQGKPADKAVLARAQALLPPAARQALSVGMAVAQGKKLQDAVVQAVGPQVLRQLGGVGTKLVGRSEVLRAGRAALRSPAQRAGYDIGAGLVSHRSRAIDRRAVRARLSPAQRRGFDLAVAAYRGLAKRSVPAAKKGAAPRARFGYYAALGLRSIPRSRRPAVARTVVRDRDMRQGVDVARQELPARVDPVATRAILDIDPDFVGLFDEPVDPDDDPGIDVGPGRDFFGGPAGDPAGDFDEPRPPALF